MIRSKDIIRRVIDHAVEVLTALGGDTGQALVNVAGDKRPRGVPADEVLVVLGSGCPVSSIARQTRRTRERSTLPAEECRIGSLSAAAAECHECP